jgi:hypothetical protein
MTVQNSVVFFDLLCSIDAFLCFLNNLLIKKNEKKSLKNVLQDSFSSAHRETT